MKKRVAILISGRGSNMRALIAAASAADYPARIVLVISNRPTAEGLEAARDLGIPEVAIDQSLYPSREQFDAELDRALVAAQAEIVCCAGFMRILTPGFVTKWDGRLLNIHPSLLPAFKGRDPQAQALSAGVRISGCSVHFVVPEVDSGPIIAQAAVPVLHGDSPQTLAARILEAEHQLYPHALALVASGAARLVGGQVAASGNVNRPGTLFSPPI